MAKRVGSHGIIYANDIRKSVLEDIEERCDEEDVTNIITVIGDEEDPRFPVDTLNMIIMMRAFHDFRSPLTWMENVQQYMKSEALLVIIDPDPDKIGDEDP